MARIRPARTCRNVNSQAWARYSQKKPRKNYVKALPHTSLIVFKMGVSKESYDTSVTLNAEVPIQLRSNSLESARQIINRHLEANIPANYLFRILVYPHIVIREHKMASGAGADRISQGMSNSFGKPVSIAARIYKNQPLFLVKTTKQNRPVAVAALKRAAYKLSGKYRVRAD